MLGGSLSRPRGVTEDLPQPWADHACQVGLGLTGSPARGHAGNHRLHDRWIGFHGGQEEASSSSSLPSPAGSPGGSAWSDPRNTYEQQQDSTQLNCRTE